MRRALLLQLAVVRCLAEHGANDVESIRDELHKYPGCGPHKGRKRKTDVRRSQLETPAPTAAPRARIVRTARSAAERFVYLAGLEHTGHHLWHRSLFPGLKFGQGISSVARVVLELVRSHSGARSANTIEL